MTRPRDPRQPRRRQSEGDAGHFLPDANRDALCVGRTRRPGIVGRRKALVAVAGGEPVVAPHHRRHPVGPRRSRSSHPAAGRRCGRRRCRRSTAPAATGSSRRPPGMNAEAHHLHLHGGDRLADVVADPPGDDPAARQRDGDLVDDLAVGNLDRCATFVRAALRRTAATRIQPWWRGPNSGRPPARAARTVPSSSVVVTRDPRASGVLPMARTCTRRSGVPVSIGDHRAADDRRAGRRPGAGRRAVAPA